MTLEIGGAIYYTPDFGSTGNTGVILADRGDELLIEIELRTHSDDPLLNTAVHYGGGTKKLLVPREHVYSEEDALTDW